MNARQHPDVTKFFDSIARWQSAYEHSRLSFVAVRLHDSFQILAAELHLSAWPLASTSSSIETATLVADSVPYQGMRAKQLVDDLLHRVPVNAGGRLLDLIGPSGSSSAYFQTGSEIVEPRQHRLSISGEGRWNFLQKYDGQLEEESRAIGFDSLRQLIAEFGLANAQSGDALRFDIVADPVIKISRSSRLRNRVLDLELELAPSLDISELTLAMSYQSQGGKTTRQVLAGTELTWREEDGVRVGTLQQKVPENSIVQCRALFCGRMQAQCKQIDAAALPNQRRRVVQLATLGVEQLSKHLLAPTRKDQDHFEAAVTVLLYMLGFDSVRVGGVKGLSDASDIISIVGSEVLLIECTTEVLDPKGKLNKLIDRVRAAREGTMVSQWDGTTVSGVIVVPQPRADLQALQKLAAANAVLLLAREDLAAALERTLLHSSAEETLALWRRSRLDELLVNGLGGTWKTE